jgi:ribose transport system permease protein
LTAGIDLSVGALLALIACTSAGMIYFHGVNTFWIVFAALIFGAMLGAVNGSLITLGRMQPFIVTLAMMTSARGVAFLYTDGRPIVLGDKTPGALTFLGEGYFHTENLIGIGPIPVPVVILLVIVILAAIVLEKTPFGRYVYGIGSNAEAMRLSGINVKLQTTFVYTISGALCGLAGVIALSRLGVGNADLGMGFELNAIAAVVVGGTSLSGGIGGVGGTLIGALIIGVLDNILNLKGVSAFIQQILKGVIILTAVFLAQRRKD